MQDRKRAGFKAYGCIHRWWRADGLTETRQVRVVACSNGRPDSDYVRFIVEKLSLSLRSHSSKYACQCTVRILLNMRSCDDPLSDVEARTCRCTYGSHGTHVGRVHRRMDNSSRRCLCDAPVRNDSHCRIRRPCVPDEYGGDAQTDWEVCL